MWGAKLNFNREMWRNASLDLLKFGEYKINKGTDQQGLEKVVWPIALARSMIRADYFKSRKCNDWFPENFVMQHDSFSCEKPSLKAAGGMRPFPTCRNLSSPQLYVGYRPESRAVATAPENCRINKSCTHG